MMPLTLRLSPTGSSFLADLPSGKTCEIPATPDGLDLLLGVLRRVESAGKAPPVDLASRCKWPPGLKVRFAPPHPSPWRESKLFAGNPDFVEGEVVAESRAGTVQVRFKEGAKDATYCVSPRHLQVGADGRKFDAKGKRAAPTLEELGLA